MNKEMNKRDIRDLQKVKVPELIRKAVDKAIRKGDEYFESVGEVSFLCFTEEKVRFPLKRYGGVATQVWLYRGWQIKKKQKQIDDLKKENEKLTKELALKDKALKEIANGHLHEKVSEMIAIEALKERVDEN